MAWLDLVVPSAAILALFGVAALVVVAILQSRTIRRLDNRLAEQGEAATDAPLKRIVELQARHAVSEGVAGSRVQMRTLGMVALVAIALVAAIGGVWYLFARDGDGSTAAGTTTEQTTTASNTTANPPNPVDKTIVPDTVPVIADKSIYTVAVFNATVIAGSASNAAATLVNEGWTVPLVANEPSGVTDLKESVVMWTKGKRRVAWSIAKTLGITRAPPIDGYTAEQIGNADVVVLVGQDVATGGVTPTP